MQCHRRDEVIQEYGIKNLFKLIECSEKFLNEADTWQCLANACQTLQYCSVSQEVASKIISIAQDKDGTISKKGQGQIRAVVQAIRVSRDIQHLNFHNNRIDDVEAKEIADSLKFSLSLATLNLSNNHFGSEGAKALADSLKVSVSISNLNLSRNCIGIDGAKAIAHALWFSVSMSNMDLSDNAIGDEGAKAIADSHKVR
eukprot:TRINITY_DN2382_c0_g1_i2.p1 TRINITY_DN2382_c0_g1~~TRINITY_DN2382_c0_g1_i2.p1  ORF type:complete len:200 (-),score=35.50 TRINITY_DN2382_c0_g1_i2:37-636(-)